jgi:hypothetical protein
MNVYKTNHPKTIVIPGKSGPVKQSDGTIVRERTTNPIKLSFYGSLFFLTSDFANAHGMTFEQMEAVIENHSQFKSGEVWKVDNEAAIEEAKKDAEKKTGRPSVTQGIKARGVGR